MPLIILWCRTTETRQTIHVLNCTYTYACILTTLVHVQVLLYLSKHYQYHIVLTVISDWYATLNTQSSVQALHAGSHLGYWATVKWAVWWKEGSCNCGHSSHSVIQSLCDHFINYDDAPAKAISGLFDSSCCKCWSLTSAVTLHNKCM